MRDYNERGFQDELTMYENFDRCLEKEGNGGFFRGDIPLIEEKYGRDALAHNVTHYHFPGSAQEYTKDQYDHCIMKKDGKYKEIPDGDERVLPRPEFCENIWRRRDISLEEAEDILDIADVHAESYPSALSETYSTVRSYIESSPTLYGVDPEDLNLQLVISDRGAYLDIAPASKGIAFAIPVHPAIEREREYELVVEEEREGYKRVYSGYDEPMNMWTAINRWFEEMEVEGTERENDDDEYEID